jgi:hypothetical protein
MTNWFRRSRPAPIEAVYDFVDTVEFINALMAQELAESEAPLGGYLSPDARPSASAASSVTA